MKNWENKTSRAAMVIKLKEAQRFLDLAIGNLDKKSWTKNYLEGVIQINRAGILIDTVVEYAEEEI